MDSALGPRIGIWGTFDLPDYGSLLVPRIFEHELVRRLPYARVYPYAPVGAEHPIAMDGGSPAAPLGAWTSARRAQLAEQLDLVAVGGSDVIHIRDDVHRDAYEAIPEVAANLEPSKFFVDGLGAELERRCPLVWHAVGVPFELDAAAATRVKQAVASKRYVSVLDAISRERLLAVGSEREIALVPDPVALVSRIFPKDVIAKRLEYLRAVECYPPEDRPLVVQGSAALAGHAESIAATVAEETRQHAGLPVVLVTPAPARGDGAFADALAARLNCPVHRPPAEVTLEDLVAAIANARAFVGSSRPGYLTALAFGVPGALVSLDDPIGRVGGEPLMVRDVADLGGAIARLLRGEEAFDGRSARKLVDAADEHFDTLAEIAEESWSERLAGTDLGGSAAPAELARALAEVERRHDALFRAYARRGERILAERLRVAEMLDALETNTGSDVALELAEVRNRLETLDAEATAARFERDQARTELERIRAERDELRAQFAQAIATPHRSAGFRRLLSRRA